MASPGSGPVVVAAVDPSPECDAAVQWLTDNIVPKNGKIKVLMATAEKQGVYTGGGAPLPVRGLA